MERLQRLCGACLLLLCCRYRFVPRRPCIMPGHSNTGELAGLYEVWWDRIAPAVPSSIGRLPSKMSSRGPNMERPRSITCCPLLGASLHAWGSLEAPLISTAVASGHLFKVRWAVSICRRQNIANLGPHLPAGSTEIMPLWFEDMTSIDDCTRLYQSHVSSPVVMRGRGHSRWTMVTFHL